jgi:hypothetical protein
VRVSEGREGREAKTAGHFAGLFHTSEFAPGYGDPLSDSPQCDDPSRLGDESLEAPHQLVEGRRELS